MVERCMHKLDEFLLYSVETRRDSKGVEGGWLIMNE